MVMMVLASVDLIALLGSYREKLSEKWTINLKLWKRCVPERGGDPSRDICEILILMSKYWKIFVGFGDLSIFLGFGIGTSSVLGELKTCSANSWHFWFLDACCLMLDA